MRFAPAFSVALLLAGSAQAQTLERVGRTQTFTIAHREASVPFSYVVDGKPVGLAVELCQRIAKAVQRELKLPQLNVRYLPVTSSTRIPAIQEGKADIECGSTTDNLARREQVAFSHHHFFAAVQFMVKLGPTAPDNWTALDGRRLVFSTGTSTRKAMDGHAMTKGLAFKTVEGKDHAESFQLLSSGQADAFVLEDVLLAGLRAGSPEPKAYEVRGTPLTIEPYALMMAKGDEAFQRVVNRELREIFVSGDFAKLYAKWFQSPIPPNKLNLDLPASRLLREQMRKPSSIIPG